jgi:hypothetical protein
MDKTITFTFSKDWLFQSLANASVVDENRSIESFQDLVCGKIQGKFPDAEVTVECNPSNIHPVTTAIGFSKKGNYVFHQAGIIAADVKSNDYWVVLQSTDPFYKDLEDEEHNPTWAEMRDESWNDPRM